MLNVLHHKPCPELPQLKSATQANIRTVSIKNELALFDLDHEATIT